jgi:hypothetical protein
MPKPGSVSGMTDESPALPPLPPGYRVGGNGGKEKDYIISPPPLILPPKGEEIKWIPD